jgi:hypothetical protein
MTVQVKTYLSCALQVLPWKGWASAAIRLAEAVLPVALVLSWPAGFLGGRVQPSRVLRAWVSPAIHLCETRQVVMAAYG